MARKKKLTEAGFWIEPTKSIKYVVKGPDGKALYTTNDPKAARAFLKATIDAYKRMGMLEAANNG